jgi:DNA polymerase-3 subunit beta
MDITLPQSTLLNVLLHAIEVVERRTSVPILAHILIDARDDRTLCVTATDLEISLIEVVSSTVRTPGKTTVSAHLLCDIVRKFSTKDEITLTLDPEKSRMIVTCNQSWYQLGCLDVGDFPTVEAITLPNTLSLRRSQLKRLIDSTMFAMSTEESRYNLNGIYLHTTDDHKLSAVATDGHRMALVQEELSPQAPQITGVLVSRKTANEISTILKDVPDDTEVQLSLSNSLIRLDVASITLIARLLDGVFPDYRRIIPQNNDKSMLFSVESLTKAVDRVAIVTQDKVRGVNLEIADNKVTLAAKGLDSGHATDEIDVDYQSPVVKLSFNANYLLDVTHLMPKDSEAEFLMKDEAGAVIIKPRQDSSVMYVIMPMRL